MNKEVKISGKILDQILHTWEFILIKILKKRRAENKFSDVFFITNVHAQE